MPHRIGGLAATISIVLILAVIGVSFGFAGFGGSIDSAQTLDKPEANLQAISGGLLSVSPTPKSIAQTTIRPTPIPTMTPEKTTTLLSVPLAVPTEELSGQSSFSEETTGEEIGQVPASPLPTPFETFSITQKVPILMYHYISQPPENADKYRVDLSVNPSEFRDQMRFLVDAGYEAIDLYDLSLAIVGKKDLPPKPVIITLDDGYRDNYEHAFPILQELGLKATFFIPTEFVDQGNPNYMDWKMIEEMAEAGMRFEPHSKTHPDLTEHDRDFIIWEVLGSAETLEAHTNHRPRFFAYPGGRYNDEVLNIVTELDFWGAVTTEGGLWHGYEDRFQWTRVRIHNTTAVAELADLMEN